MKQYKTRKLIVGIVKNLRPQSDSHDWQEMSSKFAMAAWHVSPDIRHGLFRDIESEEAQFRLNSRRAPQRVLARDAADQLPNLFVERRTADWRFRLPAPIETESFSMPFDDRI